MRQPSSPSRPVLAVAAVALALQLGSLASADAQVVGPRAAPPVATINPVDAAVTEASRRFGVPEHWIRAVMRQESNGDVRAVSPAGAMGLMQVMPGTYAELRVRYGLGPDPFTIRDNVMAGTAYLREMHDRYGGLGMLAAYNAGPGRWEDYRAGIRALPRETIGYLARLGPVLDVGSLPAPSPDVAPAAPSPFAAPIFVTLTSQSAAPGSAAAAPRSTILLAANTTATSASDSLFVRRANVDPVAADTPSNVRSLGVDHSGDPQPAAASPRIEQPANSLFPARASGERR